MSLHIRIIAILFAVLSTVSTGQAEVCRLGMSWRISHAPAWGNGLPVIQSVLPYSPASRADLRSGDVIERIDAYDTRVLSPEQISMLLHNTDRAHLLQIVRYGGGRQSVLLTPECIPERALPERALAELFSLYSPEDAVQVSIAYPFVYHAGALPSLHQTNSFRFAQSAGGATEQIDRSLNEVLRRELEARGMVYDPMGAAMVISTYYYLEPTNRDTLSDSVAYSWRYEPDGQRLHALPIVDSLHAHARYRLIFGVQMHASGEKELAWSCEAREWLSSPMSIEDYGRYTISMMLQGFPEVPMTTSLYRLDLRILRYYYTGLIFSDSDLSHIVSVVDESPAMRAGLRAGDKLVSIDGIRIPGGSISQVLTNYHSFVKRTNALRDTRLPALGTTNLWSTDQHASVVAQLSDDQPFAYLFGFRPYMRSDLSAPLRLEIDRRGTRHTITLRPELRTESQY